ncbi:MAG: RHS repeat-associated core domain-containing protein, partial [Mycobacterium sp.]
RTVDPAGRTTAVTYSDDTTPNVTAVGYDADGRRTTMTDGTGTSNWSYDTFGELVSAVNGAGAAVAYGYDSDGNPTSITYPDSSTVTNGFNTGDQLASVTDAAGNQTTFGYNPDGANTATTYPNGDSVTNGYNTAEQQTSTTLAQGGTMLGALSYGRDNAGQVSSRTPSGQLTGAAQTYSYTALQQVKTDSSGSYGYDPAHNPTVLPGATQKFDPAGQLCWTSTTTSSNPCTTTPAGASSYTFNTDGQRTNTTPAAGTASSFAYNQAGELTTATTGAGAGSYTYDGSGLRASKTVAGTTTAFSWETLAGAAILLTDGSTDYLYGPGGLPIEQTGSTGTCYYVLDQNASTVALTNSSGAVTGTYSYTTYGQATHAGTASTPLQYGAGYADPETGLIYLQNRYYDPTTAQFLTIDPALATTRQPYIYVDDNPLNGIDPTGLCWSGFGWACSAAHFVAKHKVVIGIGLGVIAAATGVGALADVAGAGLLLGGVSLTTGAAATAFDYGPCFHGHHDPAACLGLGFGAVGLIASGAGFLGDAGLISAEAESLTAGILGGVGAFGALVGIAGTVTDIGASFAPDSSNAAAVEPQIRGSWNGQTIAC